MERLKEFLYVSQSTIPQDSAEDVLRNLVQEAKIKNQALGISGSLIFSGYRFAQSLQGHKSAVDSLMQRIAADTRHTHLCVAVDRPIDRRSYTAWGLHYSGPSKYVDRHMKAVMQSADGPRDDRAIERLSRLMLELAAAQEPE